MKLNKVKQYGSKLSKKTNITTLEFDVIYSSKFVN